MKLARRWTVLVLAMACLLAGCSSGSEEGAGPNEVRSPVEADDVIDASAENAGDDAVDVGDDEGEDFEDGGSGSVVAWGPALRGRSGARSWVL